MLAKVYYCPSLSHTQHNMVTTPAVLWPHPPASHLHPGYKDEGVNVYRLIPRRPWTVRQDCTRICMSFHHQTDKINAEQSVNHVPQERKNIMPATILNVRGHWDSYFDLKIVQG